ncbi:MAG: sugar nucleotide-binding protein, partial [Candidatus Neomarinimicrobiota bacterium]
HPLTEEDPSLPINAYGKSKYAGEQSVLSAKDKLNVVAIRPPLVYGPRDRGVLNFVRLVAKGIEINLGSRDRYVTVINVSDLVELLLLSATKESGTSELYYADDGTPVRTWFELQDTVAEILDRKTLRIRIPLSIAFPVALTMEVSQRLTQRQFRINLEEYKKLSQRAWLCDGTKAQQELGFVPGKTLEHGFHEAIGWYRETGWIQ